MAGRQFRFTEPDTVVFGRAEDCQCRLPVEDNTVSRHHFLLEVSPPDCQLRDLGSLNGTYVNGAKYGGREKDEEPDHEKAARTAQAIQVKSGDLIGVGQTTMRVSAEAKEQDDSPAVCVGCAAKIPSSSRDELAYIGGTYLCQACRRAVAPPPPSLKEERGGAQLLEQLIAAVAGRSAGAMPCIPGYLCTRKLGEGGFGAVYLVTRECDGRQLALKIILSNKRHLVSRDIQLFQREMDNCMRLKHPHIVSFEEQGHVNGMFYFVMEYCAGGSVCNLMSMRGGCLEVEEAMPLMLNSLDGLSYIHDKGLVHRDLKPANILLDRSLKTAKISDLGLAKNFRSAGLSGFTVEGSFAGSIPFMPSEQVTSYRFLAPVSDVFSIGATFYNMLTGDFVYDFPQGMEPLRVVIEGKVVPMGQRKKKVPAKIAAVIDKAVSSRGDDRYSTAKEMKKALQKAG